MEQHKEIKHLSKVYQKQNYTTLVFDKLSLLAHKRLVLCPTGSSSSWSSISGVLVMEEGALVMEDGGVCITISGTKLSCPGEYMEFGICGVCWLSSLLSSSILLQHFLESHFFKRTRGVATDAAIAHIKNPTIIRKH